MKTIAVVIQRDLLGAIAEYSLVLVDGDQRMPLESVDLMPDAIRKAAVLRREHRALKTTVETT